MALKESTLDKEQMNTRVTLDPSKVGVQRPTELSAADEGLVTPTMRDRALRSDPVKGTGTVNIGEDKLYKTTALPSSQEMMRTTSIGGADPMKQITREEVDLPGRGSGENGRWASGDIGPDGREFAGYSRGQEIWHPAESNSGTDLRDRVGLNDGVGPMPTTPVAENVDTSDEALRTMIGNQITDPTIPDAAKQTYKPIEMQEGEEQTIRQMSGGQQVTAPAAVGSQQGSSGSIGSVDNVTASTIQPFQEATAASVQVAELEAARQAELAATGSVSPTTAARYEAALAAQAAATKVASGSVTKLVDAVTGELSDDALAKAAIQELDQVDPKALVEAKTHEVPNSATVKGQLDSLLGDLEEGNVPTWAQPAVAQAEAMMASRGLSTSSVGKQAMFNAIINSAMPIAQQDAKAKLAVFQQDISNEQQATLANAQFFQSLTAQNLSNQQQTALSNAATVAAMDMANADRQQQAQIENARNFLQMDLANLSAEQQANLLDSQNRQQTILSNQAAENAAKQFNAASQQQADQFNANLKAEMDKFNAQQANSMAQFNTAEQNNQAATRAQLEQQAFSQQAQLETEVSMQGASLSAQQAQAQAQLDLQAGMANQQTQAQLQTSQAQLDQQMSIANMQLAADTAKFNAQMEMQVSQFNSQMDFNREQFNVQNATAIEQSNVNWRRQMNQANTAGENAINQANAMNAFNLSNQALTFMWQENRDKAKWAFEASENEEERKTRMAIAALGNESMTDAQTASNITSLAKAAASIFDNWGD